MPDTFKPGAFDTDIEVLIEGKYRPDGAFHATNILTKCASKYDPAEEGATERNYSATSGS
ncbi:MAG: cytochrome c maturation protein CcmE [bacterium]